MLGSTVGITMVLLCIKASYLAPHGYHIRGKEMWNLHILLLCPILCPPSIPPKSPPHDLWLPGPGETLAERKIFVTFTSLRAPCEIL